MDSTKVKYFIRLGAWVRCDFVYRAINTWNALTHCEMVLLTCDFFSALGHYLSGYILYPDLESRNRLKWVLRGMLGQYIAL